MPGPVNLYNTPQDKRDIDLLEKMGFEVINPNKEVFQEKYKAVGLDAFMPAIEESDGVAFRSFPDGKISAGVCKEIIHAYANNKFVFELPTLTSSRYLSVDDTRTYLSLLGQR
jgi:hypothetical protein